MPSTVDVDVKYAKSRRDIDGGSTHFLEYLTLKLIDYLKIENSFCSACNDFFLSNNGK